MPRLTCIIPVTASHAEMEPTLISVLEHRPVDCEILLVFNKPYDDPYELKNELRILQAPANSNRVDCLNLALREVQSPYIHVLQPGITVTEGWADAAIAQFSDPRVAAIAPLISRADNHEVLLPCGWNYNPKSGPELVDAQDFLSRTSVLQMYGPNDHDELSIVAPLPLAAFYRTLALELIGGEFPQQAGPDLCEIDLGLILKFVGYATIVATQVEVMATTDCTVPTQQPGYSAGLHSERLFWRNVNQAGWLETLLGTPVRVLKDVVSAFANPNRLSQALGRMMSLVSARGYYYHKQHLNDMQLACESLLRINRAAHVRIDPAHGIMPQHSSQSHKNAKRRAA